MKESMARWRSYFPIIRDRVRAPEFNSLFLFVTSRCNSLCRTCFYFDKLNSRDDLTFDQIRRLSETAPPFRKLWISGGEPFLRPELGEILVMFARHNGAGNVNLPTNGLLPEKIFRTLDYVLEHAPELSIDLNFSLDGLANTHDAIRGVPNNFTRTLETMRQAEARYRDAGRLRRNVLTVITRENYHEIVQLGLKLLAETNCSGHYFETLRDGGPDASLKRMTREQLTELHRRLMPLHRAYARKLFAHLKPGVRHFAEMYYLGNLRLHFDLHEQCLEKPAPWPMACTAGQTTLVVDHNGRFRSCEMRPAIGNLAEFDFNVRAVLASEAMRREVEAIPRDQCWCTHSCFIQDSSKFSPRVQLFDIPWAWLRQRFDRLQTAPLAEIEEFKCLELV
jgi:MoaA/NifB/PqqE/SkfB family radical SAM enzyme